MKNKPFTKKAKSTKAASKRKAPGIFLQIVLLVGFAALPRFSVWRRTITLLPGETTLTQAHPLRHPFKTVQRLVFQCRRWGINCLIMPGEYYESCNFHSGAPVPSALSGNVECTHDSTVVTITGVNPSTRTM